MINSLKELYTRDLQKLIVELEAYTNEADLWKVVPGINNSAGNLALHLIGNLRHFFGAVLGKDGFVRDREAEFSSKDIPLEHIISELKITLSVVNHVLTHLPKESLEEIYPLEVFGNPMLTQFFIIHLHSHLNYHLGQINYHRRILNQ